MITEAHTPPRTLKRRIFFYLCPEPHNVALAVFAQGALVSLPFASPAHQHLRCPLVLVLRSSAST